MTALLFTIMTAVYIYVMANEKANCYVYLENGVQTHYVFHQLRPMPPNSFHRLEDVHLTMLNDLFDAGVGRAVDAGSRLPITVHL